MRNKKLHTEAYKDLKHTEALGSMNKAFYGEHIDDVFRLKQD